MAAKRKTRQPAKRAKQPAKPAEQPAKPAEQQPAKSGSGSAGAKGGTAGLSIGVNLGHVFALRPRVSTSFRQSDFNAAKHFLREQVYADVEEAARAVAEKALELTHGGGSRRERAW